MIYLKKVSSYLLLMGSIAFVSPAHSLEVGDVATPVALPLLVGEAGGNTKTIEDYRGKLVYLDFWASWCGPCRKSLPILNEIRSQYASQGFEVIAINVDENLPDALGFLNKYPVSYPVLLDSAGKSPKAYKVKGMPTAYLIDENGIVIHKHLGFKTKDRKKIEKLINEHIAKR